MKKIFFVALLFILRPQLGTSQESSLTDVTLQATHTLSLNALEDLHEHIEDLSQELKVYDLQIQSAMNLKSGLDPNIEIKIKALQSDIKNKSRLAKTLLQAYTSVFRTSAPLPGYTKEFRFDEEVLVDKALSNLNSLRRTDRSNFKEFSFDTPPSLPEIASNSSKYNEGTDLERSDFSDDTLPEGTIYHDLTESTNTETSSIMPRTTPTQTTFFMVYQVKINDPTIAEYAIVAAPTNHASTTLGDLDLTCYEDVPAEISSIRSISKEYPSLEDALELLNEKLSDLRNETTSAGCTVTTAILQDKRVILGTKIRQHMIYQKGATKSR